MLVHTHNREVEQEDSLSCPVNTLSQTHRKKGECTTDPEQANLGEKAENLQGCVSKTSFWQ